MSAWDYGVYLVPPGKDRYPEAASFYRDLLEKGRLVRFFPGDGERLSGPPIGVYQVGEGSVEPAGLDSSKGSR